MKYIKPAAAVAATIAMSATQVNAGGLAEPLMEPEVVEETTTASSGFIFPLLLLAIIAAVASSSSSGTTPTESPIEL
ncbi:MAG: hypothetical protein ACR2O1_07535 [Boseongicola sp.]